MREEQERADLIIVGKGRYLEVLVKYIYEKIHP